MKKLSKETIQSIKELILEGMPVHDACHFNDTYYQYLRFNMNDSEYKELLRQSRANRAMQRAKNIEGLVNRICKRVRSGETVTKGIKNERSYNHVVYANMNQKQKQRLAKARADGILNKLKS